MACAKCAFYMPKSSTPSVLLEGENNLLRMRQEVPLTEAEVAAVDDGASALGSLLKRLANVPTPGGPNSLQLSDGSRSESESGGPIHERRKVKKGPPTMSEGPLK
jgi:hypothetical protein